MDALNRKDEGKLVVPYDKDRKTIVFHDSFVDINGDVIKYDDIAVIQSGALNSSSMIYFYFSKSFDYYFDFTTYDGVKHKFRRRGYSAYGIGTYKRIREEYDVVTAASMLDVNVNMLMVKLLVMKKNGYSFDLPFNPKAGFMGTIEDRADSF